MNGSVNVGSTVANVIEFFGAKLALLGAWARGAALAPGKPTADQALRFFQEASAADITAHFQESRTPEGEKWKPLKWRVGMPLILTGALMAAASGAFRTAQWAAPGRIAVRMTAPKYWVYQNYGTRRIPARRFMAVSRGTMSRFMGLVADGLGYELIRGDRAQASG